MVGADAQIAVMNAKYHYLFWRPVTAIDPDSVKPSGDGFGPFPRRILRRQYGDERGDRLACRSPIRRTTPNTRLRTARSRRQWRKCSASSSEPNRFNLDVRGSDLTLPANLNEVRTFATPAAMRNEIVDARIWAGFHYRFSGVAGVVLGRNVAKAALLQAFQPVR